MGLGFKPNWCSFCVYLMLYTMLMACPVQLAKLSKIKIHFKTQLCNCTSLSTQKSRVIPGYCPDRVARECSQWYTHETPVLTHCPFSCGLSIWTWFQCCSPISMVYPQPKQAQYNRNFRWGFCLFFCYFLPFSWLGNGRNGLQL